MLMNPGIIWTFGSAIEKDIFIVFDRMISNRQLWCHKENIIACHDDEVMSVVNDLNEKRRLRHVYNITAGAFRLLDALNEQFRQLVTIYFIPMNSLKCTSHL